VFSISLLVDCGFSGFDDGIETVRVGNGDFAQHFTVQLNVCFLAAVDELAVPYATLSTGCA
jgi:hypothetical protein